MARALALAPGGAAQASCRRVRRAATAPRLTWHDAAMSPGPAPPPSLLAALGVSRLARVTTMDRTGIEVVAAVRPGGHVLQVTQGKGRTRPQAAWSALGEAAELLAAERPDRTRLTLARGGDLEGLVLECDGLCRAWVRGRRLSDAAPVWVPAERVYCPPAGVAWLGPSTTSWSSNGYGAHRSPRRAVDHAVLELWERHALCSTLPRGWTREALLRSLVSWRHPVVRALQRRGFAVAPCVLTLRPLPLAAVLLFDLEDPSVPLVSGYACRRSVSGALLAALLEAAQSRLTEIHGAREDVAVGLRSESGQALGWLRSAAPHPLPRSPRLVGWPRAVATRTIVVPVTSAPLVVVKAIGIGLGESELLR
jgi:YcaO-like protein with predicted kinase domain